MISSRSTRDRLEREDLYDPLPDYDRIDVARDLQNEAEEARNFSRSKSIPRCSCGACHEHPTCPACGRRMREARSEVEVEWERNHGFAGGDI